MQEERSAHDELLRWQKELAGSDPRFETLLGTARAPDAPPLTTPATTAGGIIPGSGGSAFADLDVGGGPAMPKLTPAKAQAPAPACAPAPADYPALPCPAHVGGIEFGGFTLGGSGNCIDFGGFSLVGTRSSPSARLQLAAHAQAVAENTAAVEANTAALEGGEPQPWEHAHGHAQRQPEKGEAAPER